MARDNKVRVSDKELDELKQYRNEHYDESIPLGFIIGELLDET